METIKKQIRLTLKRTGSVTVARYSMHKYMQMRANVSTLLTRDAAVPRMCTSVTLCRTLNSRCVPPHIQQKLAFAFKIVGMSAATRVRLQTTLSAPALH